jgi:hypothetical protein
MQTMWSFADRIMKTVSDVTVGTVIVLVHVMLADRSSSRADTHRLAEPSLTVRPDASSLAARRPMA